VAESDSIEIMVKAAMISRERHSSPGIDEPSLLERTPKPASHPMDVAD
jgi:hypothetical protein